LPRSSPGAWDAVAAPTVSRSADHADDAGIVRSTDPVAGGGVYAASGRENCRPAADDRRAATADHGGRVMSADAHR
jgi:hypothetical protein